MESDCGELFARNRTLNFRSDAGLRSACCVGELSRADDAGFELVALLPESIKVRE